MIEILLKNYRVKNGIAIGFVLLVLFSSIVNSYINYNMSRDILYKNIDAILKGSALNIEFLISEDFFDKAISKDAISNSKDLENILKLSKYAKNMGITYIYTMTQKDNKIYFTSSSATDEELRTKNNLTRYFDEYSEATPLLKSVLKNGKIAYEESTDRWGSFRTIFIPLKTKNNTPYIVGVDISTTYIQTLLNNIIKNIVITQLVILAVLIVLGLFFINISRKELAYIQKVKSKLDEEIALKTKKLKDLNSSLEQRVKEEVEKNRKKEQQLLHQNRLAQMGELLAMIAHHWRQPLTAISATSGNIKLKANTGRLDKELAIKLSDKITNYAQGLSKTVDEFRNFFKSTDKKEVVSYKELVDSVVGIVKYSLEDENIRLINSVDKDRKIDVYPNELKQAILNLITNAKEILIQRDIQNPLIEIKIDNNRLIIKDNAGGVAKEIIDKIFDPYFSTKDEKNSIGLGLYMSKIIVEKHCNGKLYVKNVDDGAEFIIELDSIED